MREALFGLSIATVPDQSFQKSKISPQRLVNFPISSGEPPIQQEKECQTPVENIHGN